MFSLLVKEIEIKIDPNFSTIMVICFPTGLISFNKKRKTNSKFGKTLTE
jgi:hypothetical protein